MASTDKKLWFRAKRYGFGWGIPLTWQGWATLIVYGLAVWVLAVMTVGDNKDTVNDAVMFILGMTLLTVLLAWICYKKGEPPRWRWGNDKPGDSH